ncbi:MAG: mechanosensitive ion channel [Microlunatus sp.]
MIEWLQAIIDNVIVVKVTRITFLILIAILARWVAHKLINRAVEQSIRRPVKSRAAVALENASGLPAERRAQRLRALGSLASSIVTVLILIIALVATLSELGFNVTTLVAGTSVVAAAVAFGTQSIVKDLVSGVFLLLEDEFGIGDYVDMQLASGTVEDIGLRVTQLRADDGTIWYVRNGEVLRLANYSKGGPSRPATSYQHMNVRLLDPEPAEPDGEDAEK